MSRGATINFPFGAHGERFEKRPTPCGVIVIYTFILKSTLCKTVTYIINNANKTLVLYDIDA